MEEKVKSEWKTATEKLPQSVTEQWWPKILAKYSETGREAHNVTSLHKKLEEVKCFRDYLSNVNAFILAIFFQYFNYNPKDVDLHTKNLETFENFALEANLLKLANDSTHKDVQELLEKASISSTEENKIEGAFGEEDIHYFVDLDMVALGRMPEEYVEYTKQITLEYSFLNEASYKNLRRRVLQSFLLIPNIFATRWFRERYEEQARRNIQNELDNLT